MESEFLLEAEGEGERDQRESEFTLACPPHPVFDHLLFPGEKGQSRKTRWALAAFNQGEPVYNERSTLIRDGLTAFADTLKGCSRNVARVQTAHS